MSMHVVTEPIKENILEWIKKIHRESRGLELGTFQQSILPNSLKLQTAKWEDIALGYIGDIISIAHSFTTTLLDAICPDSRVREGLKSELLPKLIEKYLNAMEHTRLVLLIERNEPPLTQNHYFAANLDKR